MTKQHPITPSPELVEQWMQDHSTKYDLARHAAQWGADQALEANSKPTPNDRQVRTSLIKRVHSCIVGEPPVGHMQARAAIREVNAWLRERAGGTRASWLLDNEVEQ
jgi:hypothetical protein